MTDDLPSVRRRKLVLNRLNQAESYKLNKYIEDNAGSIKDGKISVTKLAKNASQALSFPVTGNNINTALKIVGIVPQPIMRSGNFISRKTARMIARSQLKLWQALKDLVGDPPEELVDWVRLSKASDEPE